MEQETMSEFTMRVHKHISKSALTKNHNMSGNKNYMRLNVVLYNFSTEVVYIQVHNFNIEL